MDDIACAPHDQVPNRGTPGGFPFLELPRELRDQIYNYAFSIPDDRSDRALRIERRNLNHFKPSAAALLLILHHECFLLNRQVAREALEVLFKQHTVFLSCGPFVLQSLLERIEQQNGPGRQWLKWLKSIALDWVTFPNLKMYPPDRDTGRDDEWWEYDTAEVDVDYIRGAHYNGHYDEHDYEGGFYDDNFYDPAGPSLYPSFRDPIATVPAHTATDNSTDNDPFGFATHNPFIDPAAQPDASPDDIATKLDLLVSSEVTPLFTYLASPSFNLDSITVPLYFISASSAQRRRASRPGYALPLKIRYWVHVCVHAMQMLLSPLSSQSAPLKHVCVRYRPWDIWASMDSADDLERIAECGVWFDNAVIDGPGGAREHEGEAFRAVWAALEECGWGGARARLRTRIMLDRWNGKMDSSRVGDELEVVFSRAEGE